MDNIIKNMDWDNYKTLYELSEHPTVRSFHWSPLFYKTNGEYIFQPQSLADRIDEGFLGGEGVYGSSGSKVGQIYSNGLMGYNTPKLIRPEVIGYDVPYEQFIDISKPINQQTEYVQKAIDVYRASKSTPNDFWDIKGNLKELPSINNPARWNAIMDELYPYGILGIYDKEGYAGERDTYSYRHVKDMPKGYSAGKGTNIEPNIAPELWGETPESVELPKYNNKMEGITLPAIEEKYINPVGIDTHLQEVVPERIKDYYTNKAENILGNTLSDKNLKLMSRMELENEKQILSRELMMDDYMKAHPEGLEVYKAKPIVNKKSIISPEAQAEFSKLIDESLKVKAPTLSTPAKNINKQTLVAKVQPKVQQSTITPKQVDVPIGAKLYEAGLNPKKLVKLAKDPKVLSEVTKSLGKAITNPKTYLELGRGLVSPTNIGLIASDILVNKADQAVHNRLKDKYNIKSQAEFNKLYPTLSTFERGQLGNTYPEMYQTYMKGR